MQTSDSNDNIKRTIIKKSRIALGNPVEVTEQPMDMLLVGRDIAEIANNIEPLPGDTVIDAEGSLTTAGLINGHVHSTEHFHKGRYDNIPLELWVNYLRPPMPIELNQRQVYLRAMVGAIEAIRSGTTMITDDFNTGPWPPELQISALENAYHDIGLRAQIGVSIIDKPVYSSLPFFEEEVPIDIQQNLAALGSPNPEPLIEFVRDFARDRHPSKSRIGCLVAPSAPQRCSVALLLRLRELADDLSLPTIIHAQETRLQVVTGYKTLGKTLIEHLDDIDFLTPNTSLIHAVWLTDKEIAAIARSGSTVQHNPVSNLKLASGIAPLSELLRAGVNVSLGSDGCASTDTIDMLKVVSSAALLSKARGTKPDDWATAEQVWEAATYAGAKALGLEKSLGFIAPGTRADLAIWDLRKIAFTPLNRPIQQLVYAGDKSCLSKVFIDGNLVLDEGKILTVDEESLMMEIREEHKRLMTDILETEAYAAKLLPYYRRIYDRSLQESIPKDTHQARF